MFRVTFGAAVLGTTALFVGCEPAARTTGPPAATTVGPTATVGGTTGTAGPTVGTPTATPDDTTPARTTTLGPPGATTTTGPRAGALRAEPSAVTVEPGGEVRVRLVGGTLEPPVSVTVEPAERKITAMVAKDQLTIRAADDANGTATVSVTAGRSTVRVQVTVGGPAKGKE